MSKEKSPEEDHEEKEMEKFYALVRNYREARDHRMQELNQMEMNKKRKCNGDKSCGWMPSFQLEDFKHENAELLRKSLRMLPPPAVAVHNNNPKCGSVSDSQGQKEEDGSADLDLKLSL
ncbi:hypothetical protein POM88_022743 [Heracleum sosnowskyi]|uniref:Uncharacterized protein n=1 Tax=Heracleum sosnowskyi TaxID=360622 RepID=A0AAD8MV37_9APIA|nr:hypothetical protein POM88_022743 [Heracleum sosnowskyi]